jgi:hypothetical protein
MKEFRFKADFVLSAKNIDQALEKIGQHFLDPGETPFHRGYAQCGPVIPDKVKGSTELRRWPQDK